MPSGRTASVHGRLLTERRQGRLKNPLQRTDYDINGRKGAGRHVPMHNNIKLLQGPSKQAPLRPSPYGWAALHRQPLLTSTASEIKSKKSQLAQFYPDRINCPARLCAIFQSSSIYTSLFSPLYSSLYSSLHSSIYSSLYLTRSTSVLHEVFPSLKSQTKMPLLKSRLSSL